MTTTTAPQPTDSMLAVPSHNHPGAVREWLSKHLHTKQLTLLDSFLLELGRGRLGRPLRSKTKDDDEEEDDDKAKDTNDGPVDRRRLAEQTVELLKHLMGGATHWKTAAEVLNLVKAIGWELLDHTATGSRARSEPALFNMVRRVLAAIREEAVAATTTTTTTTNTTSHRLSSSLDSILWALPQHVRDKGGGARSHSLHHSSPADPPRQESLASSTTQPPPDQPQDYPPSFYQHRPELKQAIMEAVQELQNDLEDMHKNLNEHAASHIAAGDVILTCAPSSPTTLSFFKAAAAAHRRTSSSKTFQVLVVCHTDQDRRAAKRLASYGIPTLMIPDSAVFAVMARVHKCLLPAHAVLANGGLVAECGSRVLALAAQHFAVPVVVVTGSYTLCPTFPHPQGQELYNDWTSPVSPSSLTFAEVSSRPEFRNVELMNPMREYLAPELIHLYVTNVGSFPPSFIYRLLAEYYHSDDWDLF